MDKLITGFEAKYERFGYIKLSDEHECDCCGNKRICVVIDSSMDEYGPGKVCTQCIDDVLGQYFEELTKEKIC